LLTAKNKREKLSDEELVKRVIKTQDTKDFGVIYDRYSQKVFQKCISFVKDTDVAKDLAHDIFIKLG